MSKLCKIKQLPENLAEIFYYSDGKLFWNVSKYGHVKDEEAGNLEMLTGYRTVYWKMVRYLVHRIIYALHNGDGNYYLDHIDGDRANNRIENLREVTHKQNNANTRSRKNSTSKYLGVSRRKGKRYDTFISRLKKDGIDYYLGSYKIEEDAARAYDQSALKYHGEYARLNFP